MADWVRRRRTYRERGSIRLNAAERAAYAVVVDIEILSYVGEISQSFRSLPPKGFWGNATIFEGVTPRERLQMEFPLFRVLNVRNDAAAATYNALAIAADGNQQIAGLDDAVEALWNAFTEINLAPTLRHREEIIKFQGLPLSQFRFTVYRLPFPTSDFVDLPFNDDPPNTGNDEYPEPRRNPLSDPYAGNPPESNRPGAADPRDFAPEPEPPERIQGTVNYEFRRGDNGNFEALSKTGLFWPGSLAAGAVPGFENAISWVDDEGVSTPLTTQNNVQAVVRFVEFQADDGRLFIPDPNTLSDS